MEKITFNELPEAVVQLYEKLDKIERLLQKQQQSETPIAEEFLTVQETANFLDLAVPTIYSMVSEAKIPVNKRGKRLYFSKSELKTWIKEGRKKTNAEIAREADSYIHNKSKGGRQ